MTRLHEAILRQALRQNPPAAAGDLCARLGGIDKSTLSRGLKKLGPDLISRGGSRRTRHALRRTLRGLGDSLPLFRIDPTGQGLLLGHLDLYAPAGCALDLVGDFHWPLPDLMRDGWFDGLPYPLFDLRPQGFLGRHFARRYAQDLQVSEDPKRWSDDDILHVLSLFGHDLPGDLIVGEVAYRRFQTSLGERRWWGDDDLQEAYPALALKALQYGAPGSSAGGEFPKFTAARRLYNGASMSVIVKFSGDITAGESPAVRRWADLLICEHLALRTLADFLQVPAAVSQIYQFSGRTFLEVVRFDRHGETGRSGVCTLGSLNAALLGLATTHWGKVAQALCRGGWLPAEQASCVERLGWFGRLIGNTDMHEGNLAFVPATTSGVSLHLAPAYDMLPMLYAPLAGGEVPERNFTPELASPVERTEWQQALAVADRFWRTCAEDERISNGFRAICAGNARKLQTLKT